MATNTTTRRNVLAARDAQPVALASDGKPQEQLYPDDIRTDGGTQMRAGLNEETISEYVEAFANPNAWPFPPVIVFHDGTDYWLGDGFHRVEAARRYYGREKVRMSIPAEVRPGTRRDAILHAAAANAIHGLRRTNADKRRAVETLLRDEEWSQWSDREIARRCKVSPDTVGRIRGEVQGSLSDSDSENGAPTLRTYTTKHGTTATMNVAGQRQAAQERYAEVWELQHGVRAWLEKIGASGDSRSIITYCLDVRECAQDDRRWQYLTSFLPSPHRKRDVIQALNNVIEHHRSSPVPSKALTQAGRLVSQGWGFLDDGRDGQHYAFPPGREGKLGPFATKDEALAAAQAYRAAAPRGKCQVCGRPLTDPASVAAACGPDCAAKLAAQEGEGSGDPGELPADLREHGDATAPRVLAVEKVIEGQPEAAVTILDDLEQGKRGRYHDLILCYVDDAEPEEWQQVAKEVRRRAIHPWISAQPNEPPAELPPDLVALGCRLEVDRDGWHYVRYGGYRDTCGSLEQAIKWCRQITGTGTATNGQGGGLPADLRERGWQLRRVDGTGSYWCYNRDGHRATATYERPEDAIAEARTMQVDLAAKVVPKKNGRFNADLVACPFCGGGPPRYTRHLADETYQITCGNCAASGPVGADADEAATLWNVRAQ